MDLNHILERHAGIVLDRQQVLADTLGTHDWAADTETGTFYFHGPNIESPFEIIGTVSGHNSQWLWGWANASLPGDLAVISDSIGALGRAESIELFTTERFPVANHDILHAIGVAACATGNAAAYYIADYTDGILLVALTGNTLLNNWKPDHARALSIVPRLVKTFDLDHKAALAHYFTALGYDVRHKNGLIATRDGSSITAEFDAEGRMTTVFS